MERETKSLIHSGCQPDPPASVQELEGRCDHEFHQGQRWRTVPSSTKEKVY